MRLGGFLLFAALASALTGCGKFMDKFDRINGDVTRVYFSSDRGELHDEATLNGGLMIYFINRANTEYGKAFGFSSEDLANSKSVLLPNGEYKVIAFGWGGSALQGQARCGYGDGGEIVTLSGASRTVSIALNTSNCTFGTAGPFGTTYGAIASGTNFRVMHAKLCSGSAYPSCNPGSASSWYLKAEILGGTHTAVDTFEEQPDFTLTSGCVSAGTDFNLSTSFVLPFNNSPHVSPPLRLKFYGDASCSVASGTYQFNGGIGKYQSVSTGASYYLESVASSNDYFILHLNKYF